jgi:hypothetical protein
MPDRRRGSSSAGRAEFGRAPGFGSSRQSTERVRRIDKKADDVAQLGGELRVIGELEPTHSVRLQAVGPPDALYRTDADPDRFGHGCARPMGGVWDRKVKATTRSAPREPTRDARGPRFVAPPTIIGPSLGRYRPQHRAPTRSRSPVRDPTAEAVTLASILCTWTSFNGK